MSHVTGFLRRVKVGRWRDAEAGQARGQDVAAREAGAELVPEPVRVRDAVNEDGRHVAGPRS